MIPFLKQFIVHPEWTGAIAETGEDLSDLITDLADLKKAKFIVELGPGGGVFTGKILQKKNPEAKFFALEINPFFAEEARKKVPEAEIITDSAENLGKYLKERGADKCDCIISGLPWAGFPSSLQNSIMSEILKHLESGGKFLTFAYVTGRYLPKGRKFKKLLDKSFNTVRKSKIVWKNIPPAFVYYCVK